MSEEITALTQINFTSLFVSVFVILIGIKAIISLFEWIVEKLGLETKWIKNKREEHELLLKTSENLAKLQEKHKADVEQSIIHDNRIKTELSVFMDEVRNSISDTQAEIKDFANNRKRDREQSFQIQKDLTDSIKKVTDSNQLKDEQITLLMIANRELLAEKINEKYKYYIQIEGIPEDEVDEFTNLHTAYKGCGGNHSGDAKYEYCMNHLSVIPVETKLVYNKDE